MSSKRVPSWSFALASLLIFAGCGGSDAEPSTPTGAASSDATIDDDVADKPETDDGVDESDDAAADDDATVGFGELMEGTFLVTGAEDERFHVSDDELAFRLGGGCSDGRFGFSIAITDAAGEMTLAMFNAQMAEDLSGGVTGEFESVDADVTLIPDGDFSSSVRYEGQVRMIISEHDTGGVSADLNARRMTITLLGTLPGDDGEVDLDVTFRWVMGCP